MLQIHFFFSILLCILYFCIFFHPGGTSHGLPVRTDPFGLHYLILSLLFFLHICNFTVTKPNKVNFKKNYLPAAILEDQGGPPTWQLHTKLNNFTQKISTNISVLRHT